MQFWQWLLFVVAMLVSVSLYDVFMVPSIAGIEPDDAGRFTLRHRFQALGEYVRLYVSIGLLLLFFGFIIHSILSILIDPPLAWLFR